MEKEYNFEIQDLLTIGLVLVVTGIALAIGLQIMGDVSTDMKTLNSSGGFNAGEQGYHYNATLETIEGVGKLPEKMPLIATVVVASIILGILVRYLFVRVTR